MTLSPEPRWYGSITPLGIALVVCYEREFARNGAEQEFVAEVYRQHPGPDSASGTKFTARTSAKREWDEVRGRVTLLALDEANHRLGGPEQPYLPFPGAPAMQIPPPLDDQGWTRIAWAAFNLVRLARDSTESHECRQMVEACSRPSRCLTHLT